MKKISKRLVWLIGFFVLITSCRKTEVFYEKEDLKSAKGFYIINEGAFTMGNSSLSFYDFERNEITNDLFERINSRPLGDVFQNLKFYKGKGFLVVNNSAKIEVVDSASMRSIQTIEGFVSPKNIEFYKNKAFVTDLYSNVITVLNPETFEKIATIDVNGSTEDIVLSNNKLIVAVNQSVEYTEDNQQGILVINPETNQVEKYIKLSEGAIDVEIDYNNDIWVYCTGFWGNNAPGKLYKLDGGNYTIKQSFDFGRLAYFGAPLRINSSKNKIYFALAAAGSYTQFDIYEIDIDAKVLPSEPLYSDAKRYVYGFQIDEVKDELIVLDAIDGTQKGEMLRVDMKTNSVKGIYGVGYFPSNIIFKY
ncbi:MAG: hypothetical protein LC105_04125 [Chitinophagales bacterium]|nr:hypothetical protein [Chitinophagales bacterium]